MSVKIVISPNEGMFLKDPQSSALGRKILQQSILLINEIGFEAFNFKKLAKRINSTESSVYRYFENKHLLLIYLVSWYWEWVSYLITVNTLNIKDPRQKLRIIINALVSATFENPSVDYINESILHKVVIAEGVKTYYTKKVEAENAKGFFRNYKQLVTLISKVVTEINPEFKYPNAYATNLFEMSNNHIFFAKHLPGFTDIELKERKFDELEKMLNYFADKLLS
ncbi:MAG: TetR family transcriptional regulator [Flavobacteriales bacterium]|nr:MAG: TetR family transcriptional regulator [Flavobacteriales bacterium]